MTPDERFQLTIALLSLVFVVMSTLLGVIVRITVKWTKTEGELADLIDDVKELIIRKDADHVNIRSEMKEADHSLAERLTWLERRELTERRRSDESWDRQ